MAQEEAPLPLLNLPAAQSEQKAAPPLLNFPAAQLVQFAAPALDHAPEAQGEQVIAPLPLKVPAAQAVQLAVAEVEALLVPAGHGTRLLEEQKKPGRHVGTKTRRRIRLLPRSATYTLPVASMATPEGSLKEAPAPIPSANVRDPLPASVVTTPPGVTLRMR